MFEYVKIGAKIGIGIWAGCFSFVVFNAGAIFILKKLTNWLKEDVKNESKKNVNADSFKFDDDADVDGLD